MPLNFSCLKRKQEKTEAGSRNIKKDESVCNNSGCVDDVTSRLEKMKIKVEEKETQNTIILENPSTPEKSDGLGNFTTGNTVYEVLLRVNTGKQKESHPSHKLYAILSNDDPVEIGVVWHSSSLNCKSYFNVKPLDNPVILKNDWRLFKADEGGKKYKFTYSSRYDTSA